MSTVLVIGDTHCPAMRRCYVRFLQETADTFQPDVIVHIGDLVDWHSISFHPKAPRHSSPFHEQLKAQKQVNELTKAFPKAHWMIGNHDCLTVRQAATVGIDPAFLRSYNELWECDWEVHDQHEELVIDGVVYMHGEGRSGDYAHINNAKARFRSVAQGHLHANGGVIWYANNEFRIFGMAVGCGVDKKRLEMAYGKKIVKKPMLGCGMVVDGVRAWFEPWKLKSR